MERTDREAKRTPCEHTLFGWKVIAATVIAALSCACEVSTSAPSGTEEKDLLSAPLPDEPAEGTSTASPEKDTSQTSAPITPSTPTNPPTTTPAVTVTAEALLAKLAVCNKVSSAPYAKDASGGSGGAATIDVCQMKGAVFFKADMDIDCDGKSSEVCNKGTDASYQSATAATDSKGAPLDAAKLPYVVVPGLSTRWSYKSSGITMGTVAAVIYNNKIEYGIVGDVGPSTIVGEASYAMAKNLGINPNPSTGGTPSGVTYIFFTSDSARVQTKEDHAEAVSIGTQHATQFLTDN